MRYLLLFLLAGCTTPQASMSFSSRCDQTILFGMDTPTKFDIINAEMAERGCRGKHGRDACLISFTKRAENVYHAVCGGY